MTLRHLWVRSSKQNAILRVRSEVAQACRDFFYDRGFVLFDAPIFTPTSCEGTTNLFEVRLFWRAQAYLTQSGQLYAEAGALAFGKVYCFGPTFRAEKSKTRRPSDGILDGRAGGRVLQPRRRYEARRGFRLLQSSGACSIAGAKN